MSTDSLVSDLQEGRRQFLELVADVRPELHRYCARMTGSIAEGEDIVQETLARAYYALAELEQLPALRPWLFGIAHHRALDQLRRYERRMSEPLDGVLDTATDSALDAESQLVQQQALASAVSEFVALPPVPRSCVILKDVLGHSLAEICALLELSLPAVKAALHRGRAQLQAAAPRAAAQVASRAAARPASPALARYAALFNARDWEGVRALLAEDVRLDLVSRSQRRGRQDVGNYVTNYDRFHDWYLRPAWLGEQEVVAAFASAAAVEPRYFIELDWSEGRVTQIRDFRYVPYIAREAPLVWASSQ